MVRAGGAVIVVRAKIGLPIAVRVMCGIELGSTVALAALVDSQVLVIHSVADVVRLLRRTHNRILGGRRGH